MMTPSTRLLSRSIALSTRPATARRQALAVFRQSSSLVLGVKRSKVWSEMPKAVQQHWLPRAQSMTMHRERFEREAPAGALRLATVSVEKRSGTSTLLCQRPTQRECLHTW